VSTPVSPLSPKPADIKLIEDQRDGYQKRLEISGFPEASLAYSSSK